MTDIATDAIDLGRLAVIGESFATPDNQTTVTIVAIDAAPELRTDFRSWEYIVGSVRVVLVDVSDGLGHPTGIIEHFAAELTTEPVELGSCDAGSVQGSVLLIEGSQGPALVAFISAVTVVTPPEEDRRGTTETDLSSGLLSLGVLREVPLEVSAELGHTRLSVAEILQLTVGSVIELDRTAGSPVDVVVNGSLIARGEVVVIEDEYGIRVTEIVGRIDDSL
jgi:flagellar motor switch protein FliN